MYKLKLEENNYFYTDKNKEIYKFVRKNKEDKAISFDINIEDDRNEIRNIISSKDKEIILILGATIDEEHIIKFINLNKNILFFCINLDDHNTTRYKILEEQEKKDMLDNEISYTNAFNIIMNFNKQEDLSNLIKIFLNKVSKIIVDYSVAKFFSGDIWDFNKYFFNIIGSLLIENGEFYSECCYNSLIIKQGKGNIIKLPQLYYFTPPENLKVELKASVVDGEITKVENYYNNNNFELYLFQLRNFSRLQNFKFYYFDPNIVNDKLPYKPYILPRELRDDRVNNVESYFTLIKAK